MIKNLCLKTKDIGLFLSLKNNSKYANFN